jgi:MFS family permease
MFMSIVILGGVVLQWPLGRLSDRFDRRRMIIAACAGTAVAGIGIIWAGAAGPRSALLLCGALFGGFSFALYPLCVAHTNDHLESGERVAATGGLVLLYSVGAAFGPMGAAATMEIMNSDGPFAFIALCAGATLAYGLWRQYVGVPIPADLKQSYQILPRTTPASAMLDPYAPVDDKSDNPREEE